MKVAFSGIYDVRFPYETSNKEIDKNLMISNSMFKNSIIMMYLMSAWKILLMSRRQIKN